MLEARVFGGAGFLRRGMLEARMVGGAVGWPVGGMGGWRRGWLEARLKIQGPAS